MITHILLLDCLRFVCGYGITIHSRDQFAIQMFKCFTWQLSQITKLLHSFNVLSFELISHQIFAIQTTGLFICHSPRVTSTSLGLMKFSQRNVRLEDQKYKFQKRDTQIAHYTVIGQKGTFQIKSKRSKPCRLTHDFALRNQSTVTVNLEITINGKNSCDLLRNWCKCFFLSQNCKFDSRVDTHACDKHQTKQDLFFLYSFSYSLGRYYIEAVN